MSLLASSPWLALAVPLALAVVVAALGPVIRRTVPWLSLLGPLVVLATGVACLGGQAAEGGVWHGSLAGASSFPWIAVGEPMTVGWAVDQLGAVMLIVVGVVAALVMVFSVGYMKGDPGWVRYYALLSLFTASMTLLVIADGFLALFAGWELVGACSYLLIGYWFEKPSAANAASKAFLVTRVGDVGLLVGIAVLWIATGSMAYERVFTRLGTMSSGLLTVAAICIAIGAIGKSAQFPLHIWLPDAMEGPTPVSALIHAATMVAAGVFLVARTWPLFEAAPNARAFLLAVGLVSAFGAALAAVTQSDIKKVLAYSTISQLGFMFVALGAGAWVAAFFHLVTHAAFKALLFLGSGSVIHGAGTQELCEMGGLRKTMRLTFATWIVGSLALAGVMPLAGFFSKDEIVRAGMELSPLIGAVLIATAGVTAFYVARTTRMAFFDAYRGSGHPHEGSWVMTLPLGVLALLSIVLGFFGATLAVALGEEAEHIAWGVAAVTSLVTLAGLAAGWVVTGDVGDARPRFADGTQGLALAMRRAFGWDALLTGPVTRAFRTLARFTYAFVDRLLVDGIVEGLARLSGWAGATLSRLQSGAVQSYGVWIVVALALFVASLVVPSQLLAGPWPITVGLASVVLAGVVAFIGGQD